MSAAIRSPSSNTTTSPGTRPVASITAGVPSRSTVACWGMYAASASTATGIGNPH